MKRKIQNYTYKVTDILGKGSFGTVYQGYDEVKNLQVAIKVIPKQALIFNEYLKQALRLQVRILSKIKSPNIVSFYEFIETQNNYYLIQQYCNDGDLGNLLQKKKTLKQSVAVEYMTQIITGFHQLIRNGIVHRDLKPENILIKNGVIKIADFGVARPVSQKQFLISSVGTPVYQAPQIIQGQNYTYKCDIWAIGLIFYQMLYGQVPWKIGTNIKSYSENIRFKKLQFPNSPEVSKQVKYFITECLHVQQEERASWEQIFQSPLFSQKVPKLQNTDSLFMYAMTKLRKSIHNNNLDVQRFFKKLKLAATNQMNLKQFTFIIQRLSGGQFTDYQAQCVFNKIDKDGNGLIDFKQFQQSVNNSQIRTSSLNGRDFKKLLKLVIGDQIDKKGAQREQKLSKVLDRIKASLEQNNIDDLYEFFLKFDQNSEGFLNLQSIWSLLKKIDETINQQEAHLVFQKFDDNGDKKISFQQFYRNMCIITGVPIMSQSKKIV